MAGEKSFLEVEYDEFDKKTITKHKVEFTLPLSAETMDIDRAVFELRHVSGQDLDALVLNLKTQKDHWLQVETGSLVINVDQDELAPDYEESGSSTEHVGDADYCIEWGYFMLGMGDAGKTVLQNICDARSIKLRIKGKNFQQDYDAKAGDTFRKYCQQFYNNFYDSEKYQDAIKDSQKGGCFIATAVMGDYEHPTVLHLCKFRDECLAEFSIGRSFIKQYYRYAAVPAGYIESSPTMRKMAYVFLILPLSFISRQLLTLYVKSCK